MRFSMFILTAHSQGDTNTEWFKDTWLFKKQKHLFFDLGDFSLKETFL